MKLHFSFLILFALITTVIVNACAPKATPTPVDTVATTVYLSVYLPLTQTAAAVSPTPLPPTVTFTPAVTDTPSITQTKERPKPPKITEFTACWYGGPGEAYEFDSNIDQGKVVEILGIGSVSGWHVIRNPYFHRPCWVETSKLKIDPNMDLSWLPVITPEP